MEICIASMSITLLPKSHLLISVIFTKDSHQAPPQNHKHYQTTHSTQFSSLYNIHSKHNVISKKASQEFFARVLTPVPVFILFNNYQYIIFITVFYMYVSYDYKKDTYKASSPHSKYKSFMISNCFTETYDNITPQNGIFLDN
jgi:hypothetical protein